MSCFCTVSDIATIHAMVSDGAVICDTTVVCTEYDRTPEFPTVRLQSVSLSFAVPFEIDLIEYSWTVLNTTVYMRILSLVAFLEDRAQVLFEKVCQKSNVILNIALSEYRMEKSRGFC